MAQNNGEWTEILAQPLIQIFVGGAIALTIVAIGNDLRKRVFGKPTDEDETATQELRELRDEWRELARERKQEIRELEQDIIDIRERRKDTDDG